jgi:hypothetical protein
MAIRKKMTDRDKAAMAKAYRDRAAIEEAIENAETPEERQILRERLMRVMEGRTADQSLSPEHRKAPPKRTKPTPSRRFEGRDYTPRRPQMMKGGMYKGKMHSYVGGGMVRDLETLRRK